MKVRAPVAAQKASSKAIVEAWSAHVAVWHGEPLLKTEGMKTGWYVLVHFHPLYLPHYVASKAHAAIAGNDRLAYSLPILQLKQCTCTYPTLYSRLAVSAFRSSLSLSRLSRLLYFLP